LRFTDYKETQKQLNTLHANAASREKDIDLLTHQVHELEQVELNEEKYQECLEKQAQINNAEKLFSSASELIRVLENNETGITEVLARAFGPMKILNRTDNSTAGFHLSLQQIQQDCNQLIRDLQDYLEKISFKPEEASRINQQCDLYYEIKRKYGPNMESAAKFYQEAKARYDLLTNFNETDEILNNRLKEIENKLKQTAEKISKKRLSTASALKETVEKELKELGILHAKFSCEITKHDFGPDGFDLITFMLSPNAGEKLKPLADIASSGEAARLMLALKKALTNVDPIPVLIFDEIDAQIGGRLGSITGKKLKELSKNHQVILISHLPQIASFADAHFKVSKLMDNSRTLTTVKLLDKEGKILELAKMMSGEKESAIATTHAREMLAKAQK
jgi:DNA repair protein RecN (Recombination protein N)